MIQRQLMMRKMAALVERPPSDLVYRSWRFQMLSTACPIPSRPKEMIPPRLTRMGLWSLSMPGTLTTVIAQGQTPTATTRCAYAGGVRTISIHPRHEIIFVNCASEATTKQRDCTTMAPLNSPDEFDSKR